MNLRIRRRRFGQLAIASAAATALSNLGRKAIAQNSKSSTSIYGLRLKKKDTPTDAANDTPAVILVSSDLLTAEQASTVEVPSGKVENKDKKTKNKKKAVYAEPSERLTGATTLPNGDLVVSSVASTKEGNFSRLVVVDGKNLKLKKGLKIEEFETFNATIESIVATKTEDEILCVVSEVGGVPPFKMAKINLKTGKIDFAADLPEPKPSERLSNLTLASDGNIYGTLIDRQDTTQLVQIDFNKKAKVTGKVIITKLVELNFNKKPVTNDLRSLIFSAYDGELYALADPEIEKTNSLFKINRKTGEMQQLQKFDVEKITSA
jgi:hypothetical protein